MICVVEEAPCGPIEQWDRLLCTDQLVFGAQPECDWTYCYSVHHSIEWSCDRYAPPIQDEHQRLAKSTQLQEINMERWDTTSSDPAWTMGQSPTRCQKHDCSRNDQSSWRTVAGIEDASFSSSFRKAHVRCRSLQSTTPQQSMVRYTWSSQSYLQGWVFQRTTHLAGMARSMLKEEEMSSRKDETKEGRNVSKCQKTGRNHHTDCLRSQSMQVRANTNRGSHNSAVLHSPKEKASSRQADQH